MSKLLGTEAAESKTRSGKCGKRILIFAIAALIALAAACSAPKVRESIAGFFVKVFGDHVEYSEPAVTKETIEEEYGLSPAPEGFELADETLTDSFSKKVYLTADGNVIVLTQAANKNIVSTIDNEHGETIDLNIGEKSVRIHYSENGATASWIENGYYFSMDYGSYIDLSLFEEWIGSVTIR